MGTLKLLSLNSNGVDNTSFLEVTSNSAPQCFGDIRSDTDSQISSALTMTHSCSYPHYCMKGYRIRNIRTEFRNCFHYPSSILSPIG